MRFDNVRLLVTQFEACFRFYRDVLRLRPTFGDETTTYASFDTGTPVGLALFTRDEQLEAIGEPPTNADGPDHAVLIFNVDDLTETLREIESRGGLLVAGPFDRPDWGIRVAYLRDPDGHLIEVNCGIPFEP